ncbi:MAG: type 4a pilus biogenesis protein PilO [Microgenomates group bacterium]
MNKNFKNRKIFLFEKENQNYIYISLFLIIFSIFIYFAIRPSLMTIFSLNKEAGELEKINSLYDGQINKILQIQSELENNRDRLNLITEAIPDFPQVNKIVSDIKKTTEENGIFMKNASAMELNLFNTNKRDLKTIIFSIEGETTFENFQNFLKNLYEQRRLKRIKKIILSQGEKEGTVSAKLKVNLEIEAFYL